MILMRLQSYGMVSSFILSEGFASCGLCNKRRSYYLNTLLLLKSDWTGRKMKEYGEVTSWLRKLASVKSAAEELGDAEKLKMATKHQNEIWAVVTAKVTQEYKENGSCTLFLFGVLYLC